MNAADFRARAIEEVRSATGGAAREPRFVHVESNAEWNPSLLRQLSSHRLTVLARAADIVVFFDDAGEFTGWRDDGRLGAPSHQPVDRDAFLKAVIAELELPAESTLGRVRCIELPPVGWTHEGIVFRASPPGPRDVMTVWTDPKSGRVIQCLLATRHKP